MESAPIPTLPKVSVIMPAYNTAHLIGRALDSALQQTFREFEILVVNDGSPDTPQLEKVLAPYRGQIVYIQQQNKRAAGARNTAIHQAKGEFLAFLDSDDTWTPDHLASQMKLFEEDPALDLVYCNGVLETPTSPRNFMDICPSNGPATFDALVVERCQIPVSTVVVRKRTLEKAGFFDEKLARCDDYDMWLRSAFYGGKIGYSQKVQARFSGVRPGALGASSLKMLEAYCLILEKAIQTLPLSDCQKDLVQRRASLMRAHYRLAEGKLHLQQGRWSEARQSFSEANLQLHRPKLSLLLFGLKIAPGATRGLVAMANRIRSGTAS
ncbi:MAG: glycosyltransferase family 2 protein [Candidatus Sulfotelmatobacter sp.]